MTQGAEKVTSEDAGGAVPTVEIRPKLQRRCKDMLV